MSNSYLAQQRAPLFAELEQKPWLQNWLASIGESENSGRPLGILEAMFNRATLNKQSLEQAARSKFWGARTVQRLQSDIAGGSLSPKAVANAKDALDQIKAGSNVTQGATDQGQVNEIKSPFKINVDGEYYGDMDNGAFRARQQAAAAQAGPATGTQVATTAATPPAATTTPAPAPAQTAPESPSSVPRTGVGGLGAGSGGAGGINVPIPTGANFMHGQYGAPGQNMTRVNVGGHQFQVNNASAPAITGFVGDLLAAGAPIKDIGGFTNEHTFNIAGSNRISQHMYGNAIDIDQIDRNVSSPAFTEWARTHRDLVNAAAAKYNIVNGGNWRNPDFGHFEWGGPRPGDNYGTKLASANSGPSSQSAGATNMTETKQGPGYGPPSPPGTMVQNGQLYRAVPSGTGDAYQPGGKGGGMGSTAQSRGQGGLYIPILSDIIGMFAPNYPGRMGLKGGYMQPTQAAPALQPAYPGQQIDRVPVGPQVVVGPKAPVAPAPGQRTPAPAGLPPFQPSFTGYLPKDGAAPAAGLPPIQPFFAGNLPNQPATPAAGPVSGPSNAPASFTERFAPAQGLPGATSQVSQGGPPTGAIPLPQPRPGTAPAPALAPSTPIAGSPPGGIPGTLGNVGMPMPGSTAPAPTPVASGPAQIASRGLGIITPANAAELPPGPSAAAAVAQAGTPTDFAERFAGTPMDQRYLANINTSSGRGLAPGQLAPWPGAPATQPGGSPLASLVGGPAGGTTTVAGIPLPNPRPQMPSGPPVQMAGTGIPVPRPRPQMPGVPPQQIPQPQAPVPAQAPPAAPPPLPQNLGGTQMPAGARGGVRMLDAVPPDYRPPSGGLPRLPSPPAVPDSQFRFVPPDYRPQAASFAERFANAPGQPGTPPIQNPGMAAALAHLATQPQMTSQGGPVPPAGPEQPPSPSQMNADAMARTPQPASFAARFSGAPAPAMVPGGAQFSALSAFTPGNRGASIVPAQATDQDAINAAILDYLRRQQQQQPPTQTYSGYGDYGSGPDYASASG